MRCARGARVLSSFDDGLIVGSHIVQMFDNRTNLRRREAGEGPMAKKAGARAEDREAFAARPETTGKVKAAAPQTGADYLASLSDGREVYIYFPDGMGRSKLPWAAIGKMLKTTGTGRNWNSVTKMLEIAKRLEASE